MARSAALKNVVALGLAALLVVGGGSVAFADQVIIDGDGVAPVAGPTGQAATITACTDQPTSFTVLLAARGNGGANNRFANGSAVAVTFTSATASMAVTPHQSTITVDSNWSTNTQNRISTNTVAAVITLPAQSTTGSGTVTFHYAGVTSTNSPVAGDADVTVDWTALKKCVTDSTPPTLTLPGAMIAEATSPDGAAVTYAVSATDEDSSPVEATCAPASGSTFAVGTTTVSCSATDAADNTATGTFTVLVRDTIAPAVGAKSNIAMAATGSTTTVAWTAPTATDAVAGSPPVTCAPASGTAFPVGSTTVTCSATDAAGNTGSSSFTVKITDETEPSLVLPAQFSVEATGPEGANVEYAASALDAVDGAVAVTCIPASGTVFQLGETSVQCAAADAQGNTATGSFIVRVLDSTPPIVSVPSDMTVEATGPSGADVEFAASSQDAVDGTSPATCVPSSGSTFPLGSTTVVCTAVDAADNEGTARFTVTVKDSTAPELTVPGTQRVEATGPDGAEVHYTATATDAVSDVTPVCTPASGSVLAIGTYQVNCTATDGAGNSSSASFALYVQDTTGPAISVPPTIAVEATGPGGAVAHYEVSARDLVDGDVAVTCALASGSTFPLGTTHVRCTAEDETGNDASASFDVVVEDTTGPVVDVPDDIVEEATGPGGATVDFSATASDLVSGALPATCVPPGGTVFALGTTTVECSAVDGAGNGGAASFDVTVRDTTDPVIHSPGDLTVEATGPEGRAVEYTVTATDIVDQSVPAVCAPAAGSVFGLGSTLVSCSATDDSGNLATSSFRIIVEDTTDPVVHVPATITREATGAAGALVGYTVTATDVVDQDVTVECTPESGSVFAIGTHVVGCAAVDDSENVGEGSFAVIVRDTTAPTLIVPADLTEEATSAAGRDVSFEASASDIVAGPVTPVCTPASDSAFALGTTTVTCVATDGYANATTKTFTVTIQDTTAPSITVPADITVEATKPAGAEVGYTALAHDLVDGPVAPVCTPGSGSTFALGTTTVTCVATDERGNSDSASFAVVVRDTTAPVIQWIGGPAAGSAHVFGSVPAAPTCTATDVVSGVVDCTVTGYGTTVGTHVMTAAATDGAANRATATRSYSVTKWTFSGFFQPVDMNGVLNTVKGGSTVPLKFEVFAGGTELTSTTAITSFAQRQVTCGSTTGADDIEFTTTGGTALRYDATAGQFIQNWQTPKLPGACYIVTVTTRDGSTLSASFKLK